MFLPDTKQSEQVTITAAPITHRLRPLGMKYCIYFCRNVTEQSERVRITSVPITHCPRPLGAKKPPQVFPGRCSKSRIYEFIGYLQSRYHINRTLARLHFREGK